MLTLEERTSKRSSASVIIDDVPDLNDLLQLYTERLNALVDLAESNGAKPMFITQPTMYASDLSEAEEQRISAGRVKLAANPEGGASYFSVRVLDVTLNKFNAVLMQVCKNRSLKCIDLSSMMAKDQSLYIDHIHFNNHGSHMAAALIAEKMISN
jgi:hypothetical protein